jgi:hypothetical protein
MILVCAVGLPALFLSTTIIAREPVKDSVLIRASDVSTHAESDTTLARYYTISYSLPAGLNAASIDRAVLEIVVDVSAKRRGEYINEAPVLGVYALTQPFTGVVDGEILDHTTRAVRPVAAGQARRVKLDVTRIVRSHAGGASNYGLVVGSVTGMREGEFAICSNAFPEGAVARLSLYKSQVPR